MTLKYMPVEEFLRLGYLQELNRQFLHPLGLAIQVNIDDDGTHKLGAIWDCREDPEGISFGEGVLNRDKADFIEAEEERRWAARAAALGFVTQPVPDRKEEPEPEIG